MNDLNERIKNIPLPDRMKRLPIDERGYPVPKFVPWIDGKPEFRGMDGYHLRDCVRRRRCWLCGEPLGVYMTFAIGPMCAVNLLSSEPPSHLACAEYAVKACPFLTQPRMRRNEKDMPEDATAAGIAIRRNPGVILLWTTRSYKVEQGPLFRIDKPEQLAFYAEGRKATREEIDRSIETGLPLLRGVAETDGPGASELLEAMIATGMKLVAQWA
jgi:hypothetical protein